MSENLPQAKPVPLGDIQVFTKTTSQGQLESVKANIRVREKDGHIVNIQGKTTLTAEGYKYLNKIAGLSEVMPNHVILPNGEKAANPYIIMDPKSGSIDKIFIKKAAVGYGPMGNLVVTQATLLYDVQSYFREDLMKKVKKNAHAGRICMESTLDEEDRKTGIFAPIASVGNDVIGVWGNLSNSDAIQAVVNMQQKKIFAERAAQSIVMRNAFKSHPAFGVFTLNAVGQPGNLEATVTMIGYRHNLTQQQIEAAAEMAEQGTMAIDGQEIRVDVVDITDQAETIDLVASVSDMGDATEGIDADDLVDMGDIEFVEPPEDLFGDSKQSPKPAAAPMDDLDELLKREGII